MKLLRTLVNAYGVSGNEAEVRKIIYDEIKDHVDEVTVDKLGNLIAVKKGARPRVMLAAHMDEIGLMIKGIDDEGIIFCSAVGGIIPGSLLADIVHIEGKSKALHGVITTRQISAGVDFEEFPEIGDLIIDTGLTRKELEKEGIGVGTFVGFERECNYLRYGKKILGKALDDRIGCFILIELAKRIKNPKNEICFVFTVQEEFSLYGAKTSSFEVDPDWSITVDTTPANDLISKKEDTDTQVITIGGGPVITIMDEAFISDRCINDWMKKIAKKKKISLQFEVSDFGTTDASMISVSKNGVPSTAISVPVRNIHTTSSIAHMRDIDQTVEILEELIKDPPLSCLN